MRTCPNCHLQYDDKFSFCKRCGQRLERIQKEDSCVTSNTDVQNTNNHKSNSWIIIAGVVVLLAVSIFTILVLRKPKTPLNNIAALNIKNDSSIKVIK